MTELSTMSLTDAAATVRAGDVSPVELFDSATTQIEQWEPQVRALIGGPLAGARFVAQERADQAARGQFLGPLHGVPIAIKDLIDIAGVPTTAASKILQGNIAGADAPVVKRLRQAGAVLIAKTNTHEFAYGALTPPTRNPWDLQRMPGGSSGGSAAAVATGMAYGALGTDTAASIREPAALCGLVGHKPTYGRVPLKGVIPLAWSLDTAGPICRSASDAALMLSVIEGPHPDDPTTMPLPAIGAAPRGWKGVRVGVVGDLMTPNVAGVGEQHGRTLRTLEDAGAQLEEVSIGDPDELIAMVFVILTVEAAAYHRRWIETRLDDYSPDVRAYLEMGMEFSGVDYVEAQRARRHATETVSQLFERCDVLLSPAQHTPAPLLTDAEVTFSDGTAASRDLTLIRPLAPFNLTGHCAVSVPVGAVGGLPIAMQLVGPAFADYRILALAQLLHDELGWLWKPPPFPIIANHLGD